MTPARRLLSDAAVGLLLLAGLGAIGELAVRRRWPPPPAPVEGPGSDFDYFQLEIHEPFFRRSGLNRLGTRRPRATPVDMAVRKPAGLLRVFVIGGSVAMPFSDEYKSRLGELLRRALPGRRVEVIGMGMGGFDSYRESLLQEEVLDHNPDLIVLLSGNNEYSPGPLIRHPGLYRVNRFLRLSTLYGRLQDKLAPPRPEMPLRLQDRLVRFEDNVERMVRRARERGVPMLLCSLPVNIRDVAPVYARMNADPAYLEAWFAFDAGALRLARSLFQAFTKEHPRDSLGHYWLAKVKDRLGEPAAAKAEYLRAIDLDDPGDRCSPQRNAIIRKAATRPGAGLVDLEAVFEGLLPDGLLDRRLFKDNVHWFDELYPLTSLAIVKAAHAKGFLAPQGEWDLSWADALERELSRVEITKTQRAGYARAAFFVGVTNTYRAVGIREPALSFFEMAERMEPGLLARRAASPEETAAIIRTNPWTAYYRERFAGGWPHVLLHMGETYRRMDRPEEARRLLKESARLRPKDPFAPFILTIMSGSREELSRIAHGGGHPDFAAAARLYLGRLGADARR